MIFRNFWLAFFVAFSGSVIFCDQKVSLIPASFNFVPEVLKQIEATFNEKRSLATRDGRAAALQNFEDLLQFPIRQDC